MRGNANEPKRGEIWFANLNPNDEKGAEIKKTRPVFVISNDIVNRIRRTVLAIPLTTMGGKPEANPPITIDIVCDGESAVAVIDQLRAIDKKRLLNLIDFVQINDLKEIKSALCQVLAII